MKKATAVLTFLAISLGLLLAIIVGCEEKIDLPSISTLPVTDITSTSAKSGGNITDDGNGAITSRGIVWSTSANPTAENNEGKTIEIPNTGSFTSEMTGLTRNTTYYVRAYATNKAGIAYGNELEFMTEGDSVSITTISVTNITATTAISGGNVTDDGGTDISKRGIVWSTNENPTVDSNDSITSDGFGIGNFVSNLSDLNIATTYYVRAYATNSIGTSYGNQISFTTNDGLPTLVTTEVTEINVTTAKSGGNIINDGGFPIIARGITWNTEENPTLEESYTSDSTGIGEFESSLTRLNSNTKYYVRAYATNIFGTSYGNQQHFTTIIADGTTGTLTDIEGNKYQTVIIGTQEWMAENLKTTHYADGHPLIDGSGAGDIIGDFTTKYYFWYDDDSIAYAQIYGALYTWAAVMNGAASSNTDPSGVQGVCPNGWHIPSELEWSRLIEYLGGTYQAGSKLKESGNEHWVAPNIATNESGFTALPGGHRSPNGSFINITGQAMFWCATEYLSSHSYHYDLQSNYSVIWRNGNDKDEGCSIRCIKD